MATSKKKPQRGNPQRTNAQRSNAQRSNGGGAKQGASKARSMRPSHQSGGEDSVVVDGHYDLISVLYHSLQASETASQYVVDARAEGDDDLVEFFERTRDENNQRAEDAQRLLLSRLREQFGEMEEVEDDLDEDETLFDASL